MHISCIAVARRIGRDGAAGEKCYNSGQACGMAKRAASAKERREERDYLQQRWMRTFDLVERLGGKVALAATVCFVVYYGIYMPIAASSGKQTTITYVLSWLVDLRLNFVLPAAWAITATGGWWWERRTRIKERIKKDARLKALEEKVDPDRSSSEMSADGRRKVE